MQLGYSHLFKAVAASSAYEAETVTYLAAALSAGASYTTPQKDAINRWFKDMKGLANGSYSTFNVLARIKWAYLYLCGTGAPDRINVVTPGTYNLTDTGSPTYSAVTLSVAFNGSSQYSDTNHTPNGEFVTFSLSDMTGFGCHRVDTNNDSNATMGEVGGGNTFVVTHATFETMTLSGNAAINQAQARAVNGLWACSWASAATINAYYNGANIKTGASTWGNTANRSLYLGAFHGASPGYGGANTIDFAYGVKGGWSDAEQQLIYNATKALKAVFGITWI